MRLYLDACCLKRLIEPQKPSSMWGRLIPCAAVGYRRRSVVKAAVAPVDNRRANCQAAPQKSHLDGKVVAPIQAAHNRPVARGASSLLQTYQRSDRPLRISGLAIDMKAALRALWLGFALRQNNGIGLGRGITD